MTVAEIREFLQHPPKWIFGFLLALVIAVASFYRSSARAAVESSAADLRSKLEKTERAIRMGAGLEDQISELEKALAAAKPRLVVPEERGEVLKHFFGIAQEAGVELRSISPLSVASGAQFRVAPFTAEVSGSYTSVLKFVRKIERGKFLFAPRDYRFQLGAIGGEMPSSPTSSDPFSVAFTFEYLAAK
jgi:Tfp pilus assembly protein PilO